MRVLLDLPREICVAIWRNLRTIVKAGTVGPLITLISADFGLA
jgi:hypothetical protein